MASKKYDTLNNRYGVCLNDNCKKGKSQELQEVPNHRDFVCQECGQPLMEQEPPKGGNKSMLLIGIIAVVAVAGGALAWLLSRDTASESGEPAAVEETVAQQTDAEATAAIDSAAEQAPENTTEQPKEEMKANEAQASLSSGQDTPEKPASANKAAVACGTYEGPVSGGKPDGIGGSIKITKAYTLDMKNGEDYVELRPGDRIADTKFKNGVLQQGQLIRANGERKFLSGLAEKL